MRCPSLLALLAATATIVVARPAMAQQNFDSVQVTVQQLAPRVYALFGSGGNMGLLIGDDGAVLIDDQYAPLSDKIKAAIARLTDKPVRFVINTHLHGDHTGGNEAFGKTGAVIVAHDNVRKRMSTAQFSQRFSRTTPPSPYAALPVVTFAEDISLHLNGDSLRVVHLAPAHTDGDAYIHFVKANVIHMGDAFPNGSYPFIDSGSGGTIDGIIAAADRVLAIANDQTKIIPGHGPMASKADLQEFRRVIGTIRDRIRTLVSQGKSLTEVAAAKPTAEFDAKWGKGFMTPDVFLDIVYNDLKGRAGAR
ncbi:MAG: MBL fold metallo-hydrolase [Gemmatimonadetes bacterium]|nr:MBL fold metallo-hydrolase [Gemmatimonadota bacterium]